MSPHRSLAAFWVGALLAVPVALHAHELTHSAQPGTAVIVEIRHGDGSPFSHQRAEVYRPGETVPFLGGRTDANGRLAFVSDRAGEWRVRAFSEDGHGGDFAVPASAADASATTTEPGLLSHLAVGLSLLFGVFGLWSLFLRSRR